METSNKLVQNMAPYGTFVPLPDEDVRRMAARGVF